MKKIMIIFTLLLAHIGIYAQNTGQTLYLIFDPNTPHIFKDVSKYIGYNEPVNGRCYAFKSSVTPYYYQFSYPIYAGYPLKLEKKPNVLVQTIPISQVSNYPAKTIAQLDQAMQPYIEDDWLNHTGYPWEAKTFKYLESYAKIYVIELLPATQQAKIVEVAIVTQL